MDPWLVFIERCTILSIVFQLVNQLWSTKLRASGCSWLSHCSKRVENYFFIRSEAPAGRICFSQRKLKDAEFFSDLFPVDAQWEALLGWRQMVKTFGCKLCPKMESVCWRPHWPWFLFESSVFRKKKGTPRSDRYQQRTYQLSLP